MNREGDGTTGTGRERCCVDRRHVPDHPPVLRSFRGHAERSPGAVAVVHGRTRLTYRELDRWSNGVAAALTEAGIGPESRVGVLLGRSEAVVAAVLGIWKAGAAYVPLDPGHPRRRLERIVDSARPALIIAEPGTCAQAGRMAVRHGVARLDVLGVDLAVVAPVPDPTPGRLAYVVHTSGSTGAPTCVVVRHGGLDALCDPTPAGLTVDATDRWLGAHPFSSDVSIWEMGGALASGARVVVADQADLGDPGRLARLVQAEGITVLSLTPGALPRLLPPPARRQPGERYVVLPGEAPR